MTLKENLIPYPQRIICSTKNNKSALFYFVVILIYVSGCVPTPNESANTPPEATDLRSFFIPQKINQSYLWHFIPALPGGDSSYFFEYIDVSSLKTSEGYSPVWQIGTSDTLRMDSIIYDAYISDSLVKFYFGNSNLSSTPRQILLQKTLRVGSIWIVADNFMTSNGANVSIKAEVIDYYAQTQLGSKLYKDVFLVTYTSTVKAGSQNPVEPEYQNGAHLDRYYARDIGEILEICKNTSDSTVWTKELVETRIR